MPLRGRTCRYLVGGEGPTLLFLHGWGLANRTYEPALTELAHRGFRVLAPTLPGFGGAPHLPVPQRSLSGYADWVLDFTRAVGIDGPVILVGHSFGGGVATMTAYRDPDLVRRLILVNSIGGSEWINGRGVAVAMTKRPIWDWGLHLQRDLLPLSELTRVLPVVLRDAIPALVRNPGSFWQAATVARTANVTAELAELGRRGLPITIAWSTADGVIPEAATRTLSSAHEDIRTIAVQGRHCWLLLDPVAFGEVIGGAATARPDGGIDDCRQAAG